MSILANGVNSSEVRIPIALAVVFGLLFLSTLALTGFLCFAVARHFDAQSRISLRVASFVAVSLLVVFLTLAKVVTKFYGGVVYSGNAYLWLAVLAVLIGVVGYVGLTSFWRFLPVPFAVWGLEQIYFWYFQFKRTV